MKLRESLLNRSDLLELRDYIITKNIIIEKSYRKEIGTLKKKCDCIIRSQTYNLRRENFFLQIQNNSQEQDEITSALTTENKNLPNALQNKFEIDKNHSEAIMSTKIDQLSPIKSREENVQDNIKFDKEIKFKLNNSEKLSDEFEKTVISTYERKLSLMQLNKDLTIDSLRKDLSRLNEKQKIIDVQMFSKVRELENDKMEVKVQFEAKVRQKQERIQFLEQTLVAHEQVSEHMKDELDQLQSGMESVSVKRRAEIEELQEELMDVQSKITKYDRETDNYKMKIEELKLGHKAEITALNDTVKSMKLCTVSPTARGIKYQRDDKRLKKLAEKLKIMKWRLTSLQEENLALHTKLQESNDSKISRNDKWRNSALQEQVLILTQRLNYL